MDHRTSSSSSFPVRGIVEGFYGKPWRHHDRIRAFRFMADHDLTVYVYAPKDDPLQRMRWRQPYPEGGGGVTLQRFRTLIEEAHRAGVAFVASLSPGQSLVHSDPEERDLLVAKTGQLLRLGADGIMLSFDDIPETLPEADRATYGDDVGAAQVDVTQAVYEELRAQGHDPQFYFTPTQYWGTRDTPYLRAVRRLDRRIEVLWTGPEVVSSRIPAADADAFASLVGRPPLVWDNFPVNDWCPHRMVLRAVTGRGPDLVGHVRGFLSNPMVQAQASRLSLRTVADYLADPAGYDPARALEAAIREATGGDRRASRTLTALASYCGTFFRDDVESPRLAAVLAELKGQGRALRPATLAALEAELDALDQAGRDALAHLPAPLAGELRPWAHAACREAEAGRRALALVRSPYPTPSPALIMVRRGLSGLRRAKHACARDTMKELCAWALSLREERTLNAAT